MRDSALYLQALPVLLERHTVTPVQATEILLLTRKMANRRNMFAHMLTGSYFDKDKSAAPMFTPETMDDTLYAVGTIAVLMEKIVFARTPD